MSRNRLTNTEWKKVPGHRAITHHSGWVAFPDDLTLEDREMLLQQADALLMAAHDDRYAAHWHLREGNLHHASGMLRMAETADLAARVLIERAMAGMPS